MADYAETDFERAKVSDLTYNLNWILLNSFFAISLFFLVPGLIFAAAFSAILDNFLYLQSLLYFIRCPGTMGKTQEQSNSWTSYSYVPWVVSPAWMYNLIFPVLSIPFPLLYYVKNVEAWFPTQLHYILLLVAIEHALVILHWLVIQLRAVVDNRRISASVYTESAFSKELKLQTKISKEKDEQQAKLQQAIDSEKEKWNRALEKAKKESESLSKMGEASRYELMVQLQETTAQLRAHWFQPQSMKRNLQLSFYWTIENSLLSRRLETANNFMPTPICEENDAFLSRFYLPKCKLFLLSRPVLIYGRVPRLYG